MITRLLPALALCATSCAGEIGVATPPGAGFAPLPICINEFMPDNAGSIVDETGVPVDWIELANPGDQPIELAGYRLTDDGSNPDKSVLPRGLTLAPHGYLLLWADGRSATQAGPRHLSFWLPKDGGSLGLFAPDGRGSVINFDHIATDFAAARHPDCCNGPHCFSFDYHGTPGRSNNPGPPR